jgi:predicted nucleotidyltransferase component of viral defense system
MKTISAKQSKLIADALAERAVRLSPAMIEKDAILTDALRAISLVQVPEVTATFSGGTCLSKAYGLLERMSEDIDMRLKFANESDFSRSSERRALGQFKLARVSGDQPEPALSGDWKPFAR